MNRQRKIGRKSYTVFAVLFLAVMTMAYPAALHWVFYPILYPFVRGSDFLQRLTGTMIVMLWFFPLFGIEYWLLNKRRKMQEAQAELKQSQESSNQP
ncbi:hypothetical protein [Oscillibacter ruminantium]|nr:hypothetical protein [Oscillibacter valericigenes]